MARAPRFYHCAPFRELAPSTTLRRRKSSGGQRCWPSAWELLKHQFNEWALGVKVDGYQPGRGRVKLLDDGALKKRWAKLSNAKGRVLSSYEGRPAGEQPSLLSESWPPGIFNLLRDRGLMLTRVHVRRALAAISSPRGVRLLPFHAAFSPTSS